jgi:hypothetical protein
MKQRRDVRMETQRSLKYQKPVGSNFLFPGQAADEEFVYEEGGISN